MLEAKHLEIRRGKQTVLSLEHFGVAAGQFVALVGPNGAGKTTLMSALAQVATPDNGSIHLYGRPYTAWKQREVARLRGYLAQQFHLAAALRVQDVVALGRSPHATSRAVDEAITARCLNLVGMEWAASSSYLRLSGGEQQRVHLARVLAQIGPEPDTWGVHPPLLLLDEPTASLDLGKRAAVLAIARQIADSGGMVIAVLHDINLAARYADHVYLLQNGQLAAEGSPSHVFTGERLSHVYQAELAIVADPVNGGILVIERGG